MHPQSCQVYSLEESFVVHQVGEEQIPDAALAIVAVTEPAPPGRQLRPEGKFCSCDILRSFGIALWLLERDCNFNTVAWGRWKYVPDTEIINKYTQETSCKQWAV